MQEGFWGVHMITIGELSKQTGCHIETVRYYERMGLLPKPPRTEGGHRLYDQNAIKRLVFIRRSRELGFSLDEIRALLQLVDGRRYTCQQIKTLMEQHLGEIKQKIVDLKKLQITLAAFSARCQGGEVPDCPIIDALFEEKRR